MYLMNFLNLGMSLYGRFVCLYVCTMCMPGTYRYQKRASDPLELEKGVAVLWVLRIELRVSWKSSQWS